MKRWLLLAALLPAVALAQVHVKQPFSYSWDYATAVDRFELQLDLGAYVNVGLPPVVAGTYTLKGDPALTGSHSAVVRACIAAAVPPCSLDSNTVTFIVDVPAPAPVPAAPTGLRIVASVAPAPSLSANPAPLAFGSVKVGTTSPTLSVTVTNVGATAITFPGGSSMTGSTDFTYITDNCSPGLAVGGSCVLSFAFKPTTTGAKTGANLLAFSGGVSSPLSINFTGTGVATALLAPTGDTYLNLNAVNTSTQAALNLYTWPSNQIANAILMTFDLAPIPAGSSIVSATLSLNLIESDTDVAATYTVTAHRIINKKPVVALATGFTYDGVNAWTPSTCCNAGVPLAQSDIGAAVDSKAVDKVLGFKTWDVTSIVQGWLANPAANFGLLVNSDPAKPGGNHRYFSSSEDPIPGNRPSLTIVYR